MSLNGINNVTSGYQKINAAEKVNIKSTDKKPEKAAISSDKSEAAIYEASKKESYAVKNSAMIEQMKADTGNRMAQMQSLVQKMFEKQGVAIGTADDMWKALAGGDFTADPEAISQAKEDISEDGYWGVKQTSDRIFSFAMALSGGDTEKMEKMKEAVKTGFEEATKSWGKDLPEISGNTYDAVMKQFDDWFGSNSSGTDTSGK